MGGTWTAWLQLLPRLLLVSAALLPLLTGATQSQGDDAHELAHSNESHGSHHSTGIHVASWRFDHVAVPLLLSVFIMAVVVVKVVWEHFHAAANAVPESCLLIVVGSLLGCLFLFGPADNYQLLSFNPDTFFLYLLPPIILEAAYSLKDRAFAENFGTIILYAVIGTLGNWALIGLGLWGLEALGAMGASLHLRLIDALIFAALISAVDPVAVLAIFQELGVNKMLYFMVFGESLLNDAVTVVLYTVLVTFSRMEVVGAKDMGLGVLAFAASSFGAIAIGTFMGLLSGFITRFTGKIRVVEPTTMFGMAYLAYLLAELFHFSGIISIICAGLVQSHYAMENIASKSYVTVHYFSKVAASVTESIIFVILGVMLVNSREFWSGWNTAFCLYSLVLVLLVRALVVIGLTKVVNVFLAGIRKVSYEEQAIMAYGGLRGAVSFSLVFMLSSDDVPGKDTLMCATYLIILFTVFIQGSTIKPLVKILHIRLQDHQVSMWDEVNRNLIDYATTGMEEISGHHGERFFASLSHHLSKRFLRPLLQKAPVSEGKGLLNTLTEVNIQSEMKRANSAASTVTAMMPSGSAIFDQLQMVDESKLQPAMAEAMLEGQDEVRRKATRTSTVTIVVPDAPTPESAKPKPKHSIRDLRQILATPLHKRVHYAAGDRNLRASVSQSQRSDLNHLLETRRKAHKRLSLHLPKRHHSQSRTASAPRRHLSLAEDVKEEEEEEERKGGGEETPFLTPTISPAPPASAKTSLPRRAPPTSLSANVPPPVQFSIDQGSESDSD